jgi:hypothetical protein
VLDRRWSFGTGMPFALQDADIDTNVLKPVGYAQQSSCSPKKKDELTGTGSVIA